MGLEEWLETRAYCEIDRHATGCLLTGIAEGRVANAPIWGDVRTLDSLELAAAGVTPIEAIIGGFPCQDLSNAGNRAGLEGKRSGLVYEYLRLIRELRPLVIFMENVAALAVRGLDRLLLELDALGYDVRWTVISAGAVGAPHERERIWLLAYANGYALRLQSEPESWCGGETFAFRHGPENAAHASRERGQQGRPKRDESRLAEVECLGCYGGNSLRAGLERWAHAKEAWQVLALGGGGGVWPSWLPQPAVSGSADGMADRVHALRILGNGVVPQAARAAWLYLWTGKWVVE